MSQLTPAFFQTILKMEGGYQNRPDDTGNYNTCGQLVGTNMGISAVAYSTWVNRCATEAEMKGITKETAFSFYAWYFDRYNLFQIQDQKLAELLMNNTMGSPTGAAKAEQRALNRMGYSVAVDGARGQQTINALNAAWKKNPQGIYNTIREEWINYLHSINKPQFIEGWMYRINRYFPPLGAVTSGAAIDLAIIAFFVFVGYKIVKA